MYDNSSEGTNKIIVSWQIGKAIPITSHITSSTTNHINPFQRKVRWVDRHTRNKKKDIYFDKSGELLSFLWKNQYKILRINYV